jgi:hypothetical protein
MLVSREFIVPAALIVALCAHSQVGPSASQDAKRSPTIDVQAPKDLASVRALNDALSALSQKVTACVTAGGTAESCSCGYPTELAHLRTRFTALLNEHPAWKDQALTYQYAAQGRTISGMLDLDNLRRQLETKSCR